MNDRAAIVPEAMTYEMMAFHARRDLPEYYRVKRAIHQRIAAAARNSLPSSCARATARGSPR